MRGIAVVWLAVLLSLAWADGLREATLILRGEPLSLSPPPLWDGRELWLPVSQLERLGVPLEVGASSVRIPHIPADQPTAHVPVEPKRGAPCIPVRDLVRRLGGFTRWDEASGALSILARLQHAHLEANTLHLKTSLPVAWRAFALENPSRLVIDLAGVRPARCAAAVARAVGRSKGGAHRAVRPAHGAPRAGDGRARCHAHAGIGQRVAGCPDRCARQPT
jgi:hypothetical protein